MDGGAERAAQPTSAMTRFPQTLFLKLPVLLNSAFQAMCAFSADLNFRLPARHTGSEATSYAALCLPLRRAGKSPSTGLCLFVLLNKEVLTLKGLMQLTSPRAEPSVTVFFENQHRMRDRPVKAPPPFILQASAAFVAVNQLY